MRGRIMLSATGLQMYNTNNSTSTGDGSPRRNPPSILHPLHNAEPGPSGPWLFLQLLLEPKPVEKNWLRQIFN